MNIDSLAVVATKLAKGGDNVSIIVDPNIARYVLFVLKKKNKNLHVFVECQDSLSQDIVEAKNENVPFMISFSADDEIITEKVHTTYTDLSFERDVVFFIQKKYNTIKKTLKPEVAIMF